MASYTKRQPIPFGKYLLLDRVNVGGMAEVWRAKQVGAQGFERLVAIKRILPNIAEDEEFITMFIDEAKITVQLTHANIAQVYELGHVQNSYFIAMEYIAGKDMRAVFERCRKQGEPAPIPLTCYVLSKMCEGLDYAHRKKDGLGREMNVVHRDVSPQNILVSYEGEVKVIDFGIAKAAGKASKTQAGILKGKFAYMSPEQIRGLPLDRRSDIFAIGICLYEMLTGERLFVGDSDFSVLERVRKAEVTPPSQFNRRIPETLEKIVMRALTKDTEDRYQYASEVADDLQRFLITSDSIFSRKDLMQYMKSTFAEEVEREIFLRTQEYAEIRPPDASHDSGDWEPSLTQVPAHTVISSGPPLFAPPTAAAAAAPAPRDGGPPVLLPSGAAPIPLATVPSLPPEGRRETPSLGSLPKLTAAAPLLPSHENPGANATILAGRDDSHGPDTLPPVPGPLAQVAPDASTPKEPLPLTPSLTVEPPTLGMAPRYPVLEPRPRGPKVPPAPASKPAPPAPSVPSAQGRNGKDRAAALQKPPTVAAPDPPAKGSADRTEPSGFMAGLDRRQLVLFGAAGVAVAVLIAALIVVLFGRPQPQGWLVIYIPAGLEQRVHINVNGHDEDMNQIHDQVWMRQLRKGTAVVLITAPGYEPFTRSVNVTGGDQPAYVTYKPEVGQDALPLTVTVIPEEAEITLNGEVVKKAGDRPGQFAGAFPGGKAATLEFSALGYRSDKRILEPSSRGTPVKMDVRLERLVFAAEAESAPTGASVVVNGTEAGVTPCTVKLPYGTKSVTFRKHCYDDLEMDVQLPDESIDTPIPLNASLHHQPGCH